MHRAHMIEKAAYIPENKLEMVCIIQLGMIEPLAFFSLIYPINHAITPVNIMIKIVFKTPTSAKNIAPCNKPNNNACMKFAILKPNLFASLFNINPLNKSSSGNAVLNAAYTTIAGIAATPSPVNSEVAVSISRIV